MKSAILVNGVPASGKSSVARAVADRLGAPLMVLDTAKQPLFDHFGLGEREHNRKLGRASYEIIFSVIGDWPDPSIVVVDAWFGFQPIAILEKHLLTAGIARTAEIWCHAPPAVLADRYASRVATRSAGHPGLDYVPELIALAEQARPTGLAPRFDVDTTLPLAIEPLITWLDGTIGGQGINTSLR